MLKDSLDGFMNTFASVTSSSLQPSDLFRQKDIKL